MKILVRGTNWIGDAVMSIPALKTLRRVFPDASITLHTRSWAEGLFGEVDFIDEIVTFDKHRWKAKDIYDNSRFLRSDGYDLAVLFPNSFESALTSILSRIPRRFGYNKDVRGLLLTDPIAVPEWKNRRHEAFYYLNLVSAVEQRVLGTGSALSGHEDTSINVHLEKIAAAKERLVHSGVDPEKKLVAMGVGSTNSLAKRWPAEFFGELAGRLAGNGAEIVLLGSEGDRAVALEVMMSAGVHKLTDLSGKTTLDEAVALLAAVDLMVTNDMGLAHIAPAVGTETIVLFGPTNPVTTRPFSDKATILTKGVECSPCLLRTCPIDHRCMTWMSVEEVLAEANIALNRNPEHAEVTLAIEG